MVAKHQLPVFEREVSPAVGLPRYARLAARLSHGTVAHRVSKLHPIDFAMIAKACGGTGFTIDDPANCGEILDQALATS